MLNRDHGYQATLLEMERDLYGPPRTQFPIQVALAGQAYDFDIWDGRQLPDKLLAFDTETAAIAGNEIPQLAVAAISGDQGSSYFIHPSNLARFITQHNQAYWCCHNAAFDFWVTAQALHSVPTALAAWWDLAGAGRLCCTMLLDCLIRLARNDAEPINRDLGTVAAEYCGLKIDKQDPFRLRYGELIDIPDSFWRDTDPGFWLYAAKDPIATLRVAQRQFQIAQDLIKPHRSELLPNALRRFGPLTACLQVQGAIALDYLSRTGVQIDLDQATQLRSVIAKLVKQHMQQLEDLGGTEIFRRYGPRSKQAGQYQLSASGVAKRNAKLVKQRLQQIAKASNAPIRPPKNKDGLVTDSVKYWKQHQDIDPFVAAYVNFNEQAKLMQFFAKLDSQRVYPKYRPLVRTGRTSCSNPNLQQLPRDARFREMIIAPPGYWLLQIDYSVLELRTLAQICLRRYGKSVLADLFRQGIDPHKYTASLLLGISLEQFHELPATDQKRYRQRAKACFHPDVEVLTPDGWKRVASLNKEDKVAQFWPESGLVEFAKPLALTQREQQPLVRVSNESMDIRVTPDHRMVGYRDSGHPAVVVPAKMNDVLRGTWNAGELRQGLRIGALDEQYVRQIVCIQADGSVSKSGHQVRFGFTKLRKIRRIQEIFSDARERSHGAIATGFVVSWKPVHALLLSKDKHFNVKNLLRLPLALRQAFLDELQYWDSHVRKGGKSFSYSTVIKHNADTVAAVCAISGWKASITKQVPKNANHRDCYTVCIKKRAYSRSGTFKIDELPGRHTVHCLSMPSSFVIARDHGKTVCVGQCNFGVPGGLGAASLVAYAKQSYGVELTLKQAKDFRQQLTTQVYPELSATLRDTQVADMTSNLHTTEAKVRQAFAQREQRQHASRIVAGCAETPDGEKYDDGLIAHVWLCLQQLNSNPDLQHAITAQQPSTLLMRRIFFGNALAISGRLRGHVGFSQKANTPFQGLAADGNKLALFRLLRDGFQVCGFIHDEMLILIPDGIDYTQAVERVEQILVIAMQELCPDIPICTEYLLADRWYKEAAEQPRDEKGRIIPCIGGNLAHRESLT